MNVEAHDPAAAILLWWVGWITTAPLVILAVSEWGAWWALAIAIPTYCLKRLVAAGEPAR